MPGLTDLATRNLQSLLMTHRERMPDGLETRVKVCTAVRFAGLRVIEVVAVPDTVQVEDLEKWNHFPSPLLVVQVVRGDDTVQLSGVFAGLVDSILVIPKSDESLGLPWLTALLVVVVERFVQ